LVQKNEKDEDFGHVFIDRDGTLFRYVLDFLRDDEVVLPEDPLERAMLVLEFEYFGLPNITSISQPKSLATTTSRAASSSSSTSSREGADIILGSEIGSGIGRIIDGLLKEKERMLDEAEIAMSRRQEAIVEEQEMVADFNNLTQERILLNVGGVTMATTRTTLCFDKDSMLYPIFAPDTLHTVIHDREGRVFIDRDGGKFRVVLNFLRNASLGRNLSIPESNLALRSEFDKLLIRLPDLHEAKITLQPAAAWMADKCSSNVRIEGRVVTKMTGDCIRNAGVLLNRTSARLKSRPGKYGAGMIGLASRSSFNPNERDAYLSTGRFFNPNNHRFYDHLKEDGTRSLSGVVMVTGVMEIRYDEEEHTISFAFDGEDRGVRFSDVYGDDLCVAVLLYARGSGFELLDD
jgi:hypothetical protein